MAAARSVPQAWAPHPSPCGGAPSHTNRHSPTRPSTPPQRFVTPKSRVMFRPSDIQLFTEFVDAVDGHAVTGATVSDKTNLGWTVRYALKFDDDVEVDYSVTRDQAVGPLGLDVGQRIYLYVKPAAMMGFDPDDIDSAPLL